MEFVYRQRVSPIRFGSAAAQVLYLHQPWSGDLPHRRVGSPGGAGMGGPRGAEGVLSGAMGGLARLDTPRKAPKLPPEVPKA